MPSRVPINAAKALAEAQGLKQVILCGWDGVYTHIVTYGKSAEDCDQAAQGGDRIKKALGWPESANALPSRVKRLTSENQRLRERVTELEKDAEERVAEEEQRCPDCGQVPTMVWTGGAVKEPSHVVCGCDAIKSREGDFRRRIEALEKALADEKLAHSATVARELAAKSKLEALEAEIEDAANERRFYDCD